MQELDIEVLKRLVRELESDDAFARRDAIEHLAVLTQQRLNFRWSAAASERRRAVRRWRRFVAREERQRRGHTVQKTIQILAGGKIDKKSLEAALQGLAPEQKKALMAQVLAKVQAQHGGPLVGAAPVPAPCAECERRPATAQVTELLDDGGYECRALCEVCAHRTGAA